MHPLVLLGFLGQLYLKSLYCLMENLDLFLSLLALMGYSARSPAVQLCRLVLCSLVMSNEELGGLVIIA